ncbi:MAG: DUF4349 domain-containing protein [Oscillospiraceae bacterium]|jgi:preprotein translocase subunit SecG
MKKNTRLLAVLLVLTMLALTFTACASSSKMAAYEQSASEASYDTASWETSSVEAPAATANEDFKMEAPAEEAEYEEGALATTTAVTQDEAPEAAATDVASKIIYSADLSAQTTDFDTAISTLDAQIAAFGGFIERSDVNGDTRYNNDGTTSIINRWAYYTIRVPASRFEEFLHQTEGIGNVTSVSRYAENVTSQYTDYEARLDSLRTQEERLLAMLEKSEDVESLIALEQRLADVRYELESIERNLRNLDLQISYSTINLNLQEVEVYTPTVPVQRTFGEKLSDAFSDGWTGFVRGLQYFCLGLASSLPGLVLFVLIVLALFFLVRSILRKVKSGRKAKQEASQQPPEQDSKSE